MIKSSNPNQDGGQICFVTVFRVWGLGQFDLTYETEFVNNSQNRTYNWSANRLSFTRNIGCLMNNATPTIDAKTI